MENIDRLCMNCFSALTAGAVCSNCGFDNDKQNEIMYLPLKTVLCDHYVVGKVISHESDAAIYMAYDLHHNKVCTVREFLPKGIANRLEGNRDVHVRERFKKDFEIYKSSFIGLWNTVLKLRNFSASLPVFEVFESNLTAYSVCEYMESVTLREFLLSTPEGTIAWEKAQVMFMPVLTALEFLHENGILHGSITPDNLILCRDGKVRLKGFCISECNTATSDLEFNLNKGYTAIEQYDNKHKMCPATDIYAFSACIYRALVGSNPPDAPSRETNDKLMIPNRIAETIPTHVIRALGSGLQIYPEKRTQSASRFRELLNAAPSVVAASASPTAHIENIPEQEEEMPPEPIRSRRAVEEKKTNKAKVWIIAVIVLVVIGVGVYFGVKYIPTGEEPETPSDIAPQSFVVPDFISAGFTQSDVENNGVWNDQFKIVFTAEYSKDAEEGIIFKQSVASGETINQGTEVMLTVSKGVQTEVVPNVGGLSLELAQKTLEDKGFKVSTVEVYNDGSHVVNTVKSSYGMAPKEGDVVAVGEEIILQVYGEVQTMPDPDTDDLDGTNDLD